MIDQDKSKTSRKTLSVVIPNYNDGEYIAASLKGVCEQTCPADEVIVVDDGSTDNSREIVRQLMPKYPNLNLVCNEVNRGTNYTINRGVTLAKGDYILLSSANDLILPGLFEKSMTLLTRYPQAGLCCADMHFLNVKEGFYYRNSPEWTSSPGYLSPEALVEVIRKSKIRFPFVYTTIAKRECLPKIAYRPELEWYGDWFCMLLIALRNGCCYIPEPLAEFRWLDRGYFQSGIQNHKRYREVFENVIRLLASPEYEDVTPSIIRGRCLQFMQLYGRTPNAVLHALRTTSKWNKHAAALFFYVSTEYLQDACCPAAINAALQQKVFKPLAWKLHVAVGRVKNLCDRVYARAFHEYDKTRSMILKGLGRS